MPSWSDEIFEALLTQGLWHEKVDDNVTGEKLTTDLIRQIVTRYRAQPDDPKALQDMGLFALAMVLGRSFGRLVYGASL